MARIESFLPTVWQNFTQIEAGLFSYFRLGQYGAQKDAPQKYGAQKDGAQKATNLVSREAREGCSPILVSREVREAFLCFKKGSGHDVN